MDDRIQAVLTFWFGDPAQDETGYAARRGIWFGKDPAFDQQVRDRFLGLHQDAATGQLDHWQSSAHGSLALVILLDQCPRNMFRDSPQAFATDSQALSVAQNAIAQGFDHTLLPEERLFLYLPFEHSEQLGIQQRSLQLFQRLSADAPELQDTYDYALRHHRVIEQFGRFPHRNAILGRETTPTEADFLRQPGSSF